MTDATPHAVDQPIPMVCLIDDICRILQMSESQFHTLRRHGQFPIPELLPKIGSRPRFRGVDVRRYVNGGEVRRAPMRRLA